MSQTRNFLNHITALISVHRMEKKALIKKFGENPDLELFYKNQVAAFEQKFEKELRKMLNDHIHYLEEKDPYGREPLWGAEAKKALFVEVVQNLASRHGQEFIHALSNETATLLDNEIIDQPRWPQLKLDNIYHFFKSMISNKTAYSENSDKPEQKFPKNKG